MYFDQLLDNMTVMIDRSYVSTVQSYNLFNRNTMGFLSKVSQSCRSMQNDCQLFHKGSLIASNLDQKAIRLIESDIDWIIQMIIVTPNQSIECIKWGRFLHDIVDCTSKGDCTIRA